jgi:hypothetical protein
MTSFFSVVFFALFYCFSCRTASVYFAAFFFDPRRPLLLRHIARQKGASSRNPHFSKWIFESWQK